MINTTLNSLKKKQAGVSVLGITLILLLSLTIIIFFTAYTVITHQKISSNLFRTEQAFNAAESGLEYALSYLNENKATVTNNLTLNATLPDSSTYNVQYTFSGPGGSNELILIRSTGTSADSTATQSIQQLVKIAALFGSPPPLPFKGKEEVELDGNAIITNLENNDTIDSGGQVKIDGNAETVLAGGTGSDKNNIGSDVTQNNAETAAMSDTEFETSVLGRTIASFQGFADVSYSNSSTHDYSSELNGQQGVTVWISQSSGEAKLNDTIIIGSESNPVTLVISGNADFNGNVTIYGNVIVSGELKIVGNLIINGMVYSGDEFELSGNAIVTGGAATAGEFKMNGNAEIIYSSSTLESTSKASGSYGKVAGSWRDF